MSEPSLPSSLFTLPLLGLMLLGGCRGTEVGNGKTEGSAGGATGAVTPTSTEASSPTTSPVSGSATDYSEKADTISSSEGAKVWLLASCASPFADNISGNFVDAQGKVAFSVAINSDGSKTIKMDNMTYKVSPYPSLGTFAVNVTPELPKVSCDPLESIPTATGLIRSVSLSNGVQVTWELNAGSVVKLTLSPDPVTSTKIFTKQ